MDGVNEDDNRASLHRGKGTRRTISRRVAGEKDDAWLKGKKEQKKKKKKKRKKEKKKKTELRSRREDSLYLRAGVKQERKERQGQSNREKESTRTLAVESARS